MIKRTYFGVLLTGTFIFVLGLVLGWMQDYHPAFDSLSQFRLHFVAVLLIATLFLIFGRRRLWVVVSLATGLFSLWLTLPYIPDVGGASHKQGVYENRAPANFSVVQFNMRFNNSDLDAAIASLRSVDADVYLLQELTNRNLRVFTELKKTHPYQLECISYVVGSVAVASRHPFAPQSQNSCNRRDGLVSARIMVGKVPITIASAHLRWPWPYSQHNQITRLNGSLSTLEGPLILAGDFNAAPWSHAIKRITKITKSKVMEGLILSWRHRLLKLNADIGPVLPLDQILYRGIIPISRRIMSEAGSDHYPIHTKFYVGK